MTEQSIDKSEFRVFGYGNIYPTHIRVNDYIIEIQAGGFDSEYARISGEDAVEDLLALENSSGDPIFTDEEDLMNTIATKLL